MFDIRIDGGILALENQRDVVGSVGIIGSRIAAIGDLSEFSAKRVIDASGCYVVPGAIDAHVHLGFADPEAEWETETALAAVSGVTLPMIYFRSLEPYGQNLTDFIAEGAERSHVDFGVHVGILNDDHLNSLADLTARFGFRSIKMYTTYKDGSLARFGVMGQDDVFILEVLEKAGKMGLTTVIHAENDDIVKRADGLAGATDEVSLETWSAVRSPLAEVEAIRRLGLFSRQTEARIHIPHVSAEAALLAALEERSLGAQLTIETAPQFLRPRWLSDAGVLAKANPPVRVGEDGEAHWSALRCGELDVLATDHGAWQLTSKTHARFSANSSGFPGLGTFLPFIMDSVVNGAMTLSDYTRLNRRAAEIFDLPDRGALTPGHVADVVIVDPGRVRSVPSRSRYGLSDFTPFAGRRLAGWPVHTIAAGRMIAEDGELVAEGLGRYVRESKVPVERRANRKGAQ